jgi:PTH2 family peptidyl-tRNA hydrolase
MEQLAIKQIILIRTDLNMGKGKMVTQGAHASVKCIEQILNPSLKDSIGMASINCDTSFVCGTIGHQVIAFHEQLLLDYATDQLLCITIKEKWKQWYQVWNRDCWYKKITLKVANFEELVKYSQLAFVNKLPLFMVKDKGLTQLEPETYTACAFLGTSNIVDTITKDLKLL